MVYHSRILDISDETPRACGCPLLPVRNPGEESPSESGAEDIVDEALQFFRANVLFRKFEVKTPADKLLIYLTLFINTSLRKVEACKSHAEGSKLLLSASLESFPLPGEPGFPLGNLLTPARSREEAETFRAYMRQVREETVIRLLKCVYLPDGTPNKWWMAFSKRKFMNLLPPT